MSVLWATSLPGLVFLLVVVAALERLDERNHSLMMRQDEGDGALFDVDLNGRRIVLRERLPDR